MLNNDTIAAISTPIGKGGIGIVRLSGPLSFQIGKKILKLSSSDNLLQTTSHTVLHGWLFDPERKISIDEVLVTLLREPKTYTREDMLEISCHGGEIALKEALALCMKNGARIAEPGEFTKRAFLNGRIDLSQAEAVLDIINSGAEKSLLAAAEQLQGGLGKRINEIKDSVINTVSQLEASVDFPEEELEFEKRENILKGLSSQVEKIDSLLSTERTGKILREGLTCSIVGKPNVGKSTLFNILLDEERSIVTPVPGTTRDFIKEEFSVDGFPLKLADTAGIAEMDDELGREGVRRSREQIKKSDFVIFLLDASRGLSDEDGKIFSLIESKEKIILLNKTDLPKKINTGILNTLINREKFIEVSLKEKKGVDEFLLEIKRIITGNNSGEFSAITINLRHKSLLEKTKESIRKAEKSIRDNLSEEFASFDLKEALNYLGEITGETYTEEILNRIFENFCIGK
ncbi:MAG: tRNA uridine-5-carboxymethylaminomethyl(34) synthesis GTPase MnmE [Candidatus Schekmanbacteria bacterium GWA2_38_9]|uniref:tRNA modification GTPase MnmE n=1 Tax=Candidatus Schekmanbacteria bacterium RIFCSPLOWO2_12_FULL_38_15 TaxID=1817883 RepID=A0A1F7SK53_9BACT|nr:MAG: tRNA uridine-5-carboxymethylaminomethyl(34) synthesis GTPase MnmE [Candidatus Schekmanbacteria bacterium GWA2_38_9]OGL48307.1 MAG: tRNA uridine-5-carboxymethylaminomethyl(34) synthesis GTPase MnmE [Candidatus Schekmanbacteria bacterium RIFCSPLOWO2_02_FULL_38_14]OGL54139.1 MAG: tRNA uridine-5-carboxymethylaminomethyl(34) synthesis GTPase MnmE [Candidatus Schekmanbacteria bacterium RIFCSPLOWO2_12_FULL_38_15]